MKRNGTTAEEFPGGQSRTGTLRQRSGARAKRERLQAMLLTLLLAATAGSGALAADTRTEWKTLESWKKSAKKTYVGNQLLQLLENDDTSIKRNSLDKRALFTRAYLYGTIGCTDMAIADLDKAIVLDGGYAAAFAERGNCYLDKQDYTRALRDFNRALTLNPNMGDALLSRAKLLIKVGRPSLAYIDLKKCQSGRVSFSPVLPGELPGDFYGATDYYLGCCYEAMNNHAEARKHFEAFQSSSKRKSTGYLHRYSDKPSDAGYRLTSL